MRSAPGDLGGSVGDAPGSPGLGQGLRRRVRLGLDGDEAGEPGAVADLAHLGRELAEGGRPRGGEGQRRRQHGPLDRLELVIRRRAGAEQGIARLDGLAVVAKGAEVAGIGAAQRLVEPTPAVAGRTADQSEVLGAEGHRREPADQLGGPDRRGPVEDRAATSLGERDLDMAGVPVGHERVDADPRLGDSLADERGDLGGAEGAQGGDEAGLPLAVGADQEDARRIEVDVREGEVAEVGGADAGQPHRLTGG